LLHEPSVPSASERYCIHASEWSTFTIPLGTQRGYARFNLGLPLRVLDFCFVLAQVAGQFQLRFSSHAVQARILIPHILWNHLMGKPVTVLSN